MSGAWSVRITDNYFMQYVRVYPDKGQLAQAAAKQIIELAGTAIIRKKCFNLMLAGGSTPKATYSLLASRRYSDQVNWEQVFLFWGDERCVPPDHPDSNFGMVRDTLISFVPIPPQNVFRIHGEIPPAEAAALYQTELQRHYSREDKTGGIASLDLVLLGMGTDGHTASLFPSSPVLEERVNWVTHVRHTSPPPPLVDRVSVTLPLINAARQVTFLVSGSGKSKRLKQVLSSQYAQNEALPASMVAPVNGQIAWLVDRAAASDWEDG
jgi:6-phosphogluconolactonase